MIENEVLHCFGEFISPCLISYDSLGSNLYKNNLLQISQVKNKMKAPVYVYYQLDNFYQNHRRYAQN